MSIARSGFFAHITGDKLFVVGGFTEPGKEAKMANPIVEFTLLNQGPLAWTAI